MSWLSRLKNALNSRHLDNDLEEELRDHLARRTASFQERGLSAPEARQQAAATFGNLAAIREATREIRLSTALESTLQDIRYAWLNLLRNPVFALAAIVSLGLAIGANTAIYSVIDALMLRPLPVPDPGTLVTLTSRAPGLTDDDTFSVPLYEALRTAAGTAARVALFDAPTRVEAQLSTSPDGPREDAMQQFVSPDAFDILGITPTLGELFSRGADRFPSPRAVVVLSHDYWHRRFGSDPSVLGRTILLTGRPHTILGVTWEGFTGAEPGKFVDVWLPITLADPGIFTNPRFKPFRLMGIPSAGITNVQLAALLQPAFHRHQESKINSGTPLTDQAWLRLASLQVESGAAGISAFRRTFARQLWILFGVAICILLITCANVASLLLARATARRDEMALRISLGARRGRLIRQLLTESLMISALAGLTGWFLARTAAPLLVSMVSTTTDTVRLNLEADSRMFLFCAAVCTVSALFFGLLPAWQATGVRPAFALRHSGRQAGQLRLGRIFVGVQFAFALCLVTGGAGFLFTLRNLNTVNKGFDPAGVTVLRVSNTLSFQQRDQQLALMHQLRARVSELPSVQGAATAWVPVFSPGRRTEPVYLPGQRPSGREETFYRVSPGYLATLRIPLLSGLDFSLTDNDNEPIPTIINRTFATRYFPGQAAPGREFLGFGNTRHIVKGIAADSHYTDLRGGPEAIAYIPMKPPRAFTMYVRSPLDAASVGKLVDREAKTFGSGMRVADVTTVEALVGNTIIKEKLLAGIGGVFACLGLILATLGLFGLLNYSVARRTKEIGIRSALGAGKLSLCGLVMADLFTTIAGGLVAGLAGSWMFMNFARSLFFEVEPVDPMVTGTTVAVFTAATVIAATLPARRAAGIDPVAALRHQ